MPRVTGALQTTLEASPAKTSSPKRRSKATRGLTRSASQVLGGASRPPPAAQCVTSSRTAQLLPQPRMCWRLVTKGDTLTQEINLSIVTFQEWQRDKEQNGPFSVVPVPKHDDPHALWVFKVDGTAFLNVSSLENFKGTWLSKSSQFLNPGLF